MTSTTPELQQDLKQDSLYARLKIQDLQNNQSIESIFGVVSCEPKVAKNKKTYLDFILTDGITTINGKRWDFSGTVYPPKNTVINIKASVGDWNGTPQLTIYGGTAVDVPIEDFMPDGGFDIDMYWRDANTLLNEMQNTELRMLCLKIFQDNSVLLETQPGAKSIHHAHKAGLLQHLVDVTLVARNMCCLMVDEDSYSLDLVTAGGLLHDIGKLKTYAFEGVSIDFTDEGHLLDHIPAGIAMLETYRNYENSKHVDLMQHIIASHHGQLAWGSPVTPRFIEAWAIHFADNASSKIQTVIELNKLAGDAKMTKKEWSLENREQFTQAYIQSLIG